MNTQDIVDAVEAVHAALLANEQQIESLDRAIGDGDHFINVQRGCEAIVALRAELLPLPPSQAFDRIGTRLIGTVGGASGPLIGSLFIAMGRELEGLDEPDLKRFARALSAGVEAIKTRGQADLGDKTMLDVLIPVSRLLLRLADEDSDRRTLCDRLRQEAQAGMLATRDMIATRGRAHFLGERARGHIDPGAKSCQVALCAVCDLLAAGDAAARPLSDARQPGPRVMKKFVNDVDRLLHESLQGLAAAHADLLTVHFEPTFVTRRHSPAPKVALISGGGSGHEPLHCGFIGPGMLDAACPGQVFTSPTPDQMLAAAQAADRGKGVLFIVKNYAGDVMNFQMAAERLQRPCATVLVDDDVAAQRSAHGSGRRGVAGALIVEKIVGAAAEAGANLAQCKALGDRVNRRTASMGVAFTSCTVPAAGRATFDIGDDEMEFGVGIHGEPGRRRGPVRPAQELVDELMGAILGDLQPPPGAQVLLHVNGFGGTPLIELYLLYHCAHRLLADRDLTVTRSLVGNYTTALEMAGASLTVTLLDEELTALWDAPVHTAALRW